MSLLFEIAFSFILAFIPYDFGNKMPRGNKILFILILEFSYKFPS